MKFGARLFNTLLRVAPPLLLTLVCAGEAHAVYPCSGTACVMDVPCTTTQHYSFSHKVNTVTGSPIPSLTAGGLSTVNWTAAAGASPACSAPSTTTWECAGMTVTVPSGSVTSGVPVTVVTTSATTGPTSTGEANVNITATDPAAASTTCTGNFTIRVDSVGSGWGDPHLTTVDGVHYDFQSAGEFTALREEGLILQTRQAPVPTATVPITNAYTGITHCVAIYTAVAAKVGTTRVTVQPSPGAEPNPKSMEVRVNGKLVTLGREQLILSAPGGAVEGSVMQHPDGIEITDARGTQIVVTPSYWESRKVWYLNLNVYGTTAHEGTMGRIAPKSWLPALPDGTSLGPKPESENERYQALYEKFADAWRVTDTSSLFDYAPGTNTATFTRDEWPRNHPQSCAIEGQESAVAVTAQVAQQACANITNPVEKADCTFDVMITGNVGFAKTYESMRRFTPRGPGWFNPVPGKVKVDPPKDCPPTKDCPTCEKPWWCQVALVIAILLAILLILLVMRMRKKP